MMQSLWQHTHTHTLTVLWIYIICEDLYSGREIVPNRIHLFFAFIRRPHNEYTVCVILYVILCILCVFCELAFQTIFLLIPGCVCMYVSEQQYIFVIITWNFHRNYCAFIELMAFRMWNRSLVIYTWPVNPPGKTLAMKHCTSTQRGDVKTLFSTFHSSSRPFDRAPWTRLYEWYEWKAKFNCLHSNKTWRLTLSAAKFDERIDWDFPFFGVLWVSVFDCLQAITLNDFYWLSFEWNSAKQSGIVSKINECGKRDKMASNLISQAHRLHSQDAQFEYSTIVTFNSVNLFPHDTNL